MERRMTMDEINKQKLEIFRKQMEEKEKEKIAEEKRRQSMHEAQAKRAKEIRDKELDIQKAQREKEIKDFVDLENWRRRTMAEIELRNKLKMFD